MNDTHEDLLIKYLGHSMYHTIKSNISTQRAKTRGEFVHQNHLL